MRNHLPARRPVAGFVERARRARAARVACTMTAYMCGFAGFIQPGGFSDDIATRSLGAMTGCVTHRGPDDAGVWLDGEAGVALGHRRLSILDLSPAGSQPMASPSGRYVVVFNGEIYNHEDLRALAGGPSVAWRGHSDTESLLAAFDAIGIEMALRRAVGMFAFAVWDRRERVLTLGRDRLGEKPLYYGMQGGTLLFGSELKALRAHPAFEGSIDTDALASYLRYAYVPAPLSIHRGVRKLPPGCIWRWHAGSAATDLDDPVAYWSLEEAMAAGARDPFRGDDEEAADELEALVARSVGLQRVADVPLGAFLSGGIDSSLVVAQMQRQASDPVRTFTIGFSERAYDESEAARAVARHLGTDHTEMIVTPEEAMAVIPSLPRVYDEPFGDASAIPTWLVAQLARRHVTVALSGDGGDELFAGYGRYHRTSALWQTAQRLPAVVRGTAHAGLRAVPDAAVQGLLTRLGVGRHPHLFGDRVRGLRAAFGARTSDPLYAARISRWPDPGGLLQADATPPPTWAETRPTDRTHPTERMMATDTRSYLPDDVLVKVDRAAMAHGLETRVPLLDHRVVAFAWSLPHDMRVRDGRSKWLLRQVLYRHVPRELVDRGKQGFGVPVDVWLRGPLRDWAEDLLSTRSLETEGPFRAAPIRRAWHEHLKGDVDWQRRLWPILVYQEWLRSATSKPRD